MGEKPEQYDILITEAAPLVPDNNLIFAVRADTPQAGYSDFRRAIDDVKRAGIAGLDIKEDIIRKAGMTLQRFEVEVSHKLDLGGPGESYHTNKDALRTVVEAMRKFDRQNDGHGLYMSLNEQADLSSIERQLAGRPSNSGRGR